jgi:peptidoglycan/xylan/chitin deacetylase (PgdA/CDA1 family)
MRAAADEPVVALTYDDGPDPTQTPALLDVLGERQVSATFFVLVEQAEAHPEVVRRMVREGHEVALHGIDHTALTTVSGAEAARRIRSGKQRIEALTGRPIRYFRPAFGDLSVTACLAARRTGMDVVIWSAWAQDWIDASAQEVADRAVRALHPGAIVLLHDTTGLRDPADPRPRPTFSRADVARRILAGAGEAGYQTVGLTDLLARFPAVRSVTVQRPRPRLPFR